MRYTFAILLHLVAIMLGVGAFASSLPLSSSPDVVQHNLAYGILMYAAGALSVGLYFIATGMLHEVMEKDKLQKAEKPAEVPA